MNTVHSPLLVDKEIVGKLHFPNDEVLTSHEQKLLREYELRRSSSLGTDKVKIKILLSLRNNKSSRS